MTTRVTLSTTAFTLLATGPIDVLATVESGSSVRVAIAGALPDPATSGFHSINKDRPFQGGLKVGENLYAMGSGAVGVTTGAS